MSERRTRRGANARRKDVVPSSVHYVGYVEDEETPEMIMKKFEALERIQQLQKDRTEADPHDTNTRGSEKQEKRLMDRTAKLESDLVDEMGGNEANDGPSRQCDDGVLTEEQLEMVFRETSMFNIKSAMQRNQWFEGSKRCVVVGMDGEDEEFVTFYDSDEDDEEFWSAKPSKKKSMAKSTTRRVGPPRSHRLITTLNRESGAFIRRRVQVVDPDAIVTVRVPPPPLPLPWGRNISQYVPPDKGQRESCVKQNLLDGKLASRIGRSFVGVLINPGWENSTAKECGGNEASPQLLQRLDLPRLCPTGFVFIWVHKRYISGIMDLMYAWNYCYVENLTWVQLKPNNEVIQEKYTTFCRSHLTMFIFRKENEGKDIELRHQRNPDLVTDFVRGKGVGVVGIPLETYTTIETLLPNGKDNLLELWAFNGVRREGWVHVYSETED